MKDSLLCGLIGAGIQRSLSPALQEDEARHHGIRLHYQLIDLDASGQTIDGFKLFTGVGADAARMDAHFRRIAS